MTLIRVYWPIAILMLTACGPTEQHKAQLAEQKRIECLDKLCEGDIPPKHDPLKEFGLKLNGQWFIGPRDYGGYGGSLAFLWPSKTPARSADSGKTAPEFVPSSAGVTSNFYDVGIEIFLRSNNIPSETSGYKFVQLAQANDWIASREVLRPGLEAIRFKHVAFGPHGHYIDRGTTYVATELVGVDGLPPVAGCNHDDLRNGGGAGFMWREGIFVGIRMSQKHCADWPEIYLEITRVLQLLRKA
jgi:hypothetical protein